MRAEQVTTLRIEYEFDVFVSYRRYKEWTPWVTNVFLPQFEFWLSQELGRDAHIFLDQRMETGTSWPQHLGHALARSRVLVPLFTRLYFNSPWCKMEIALVRAREQACGFGTPDNDKRLIVPAHIHDGDSFPAEARCIQAAQLQEYADPFMADGSPKGERLSEHIQCWVKEVREAIDRAPVCDPSWTMLAVEACLGLFEGSAPRQDAPPGLAGP